MSRRAMLVVLVSRALFACGLLLFVVTLIINAIARRIVGLGDPVRRAERARKKARRAAAEGGVA